MAEQQIRFCNTEDGVTIAYALVGSGPPCVWISRFVDTIESTWQWGRDLIERYAADFTVVRYDIRGLGLSQQGASDFSIETRVRDLEAVIEDLKLERFLLRALSDGCQTAIAFAAKHPDKVERLILIGGFASGPKFRAMREGLSEALVALLRAEPHLAATTLSTMLTGVLPENVEQFFPVEQESRVNLTVALIEALSTVDVSDMLSRVVAPTLVVHGLRDKTVPSELGRDLASGIPDATFFTYDGDHMPNNQAAIDQVSRAVWNFLKLGAYKETVTSLRRAMVAVLFTDIVGHTEMMQRLGDERGRDVLREHERITRSLLQANDGEELKTAGDGFMVSFSSVTNAAECAIALQRAFSERNESAAEPLHVRVGINAGEPIAEEGDLFGATVILASRIAAQAGAGEILVPDTVRGLCSGKGFAFAARGEFVPKGFDDAVRLYEVRWR